MGGERSRGAGAAMGSKMAAPGSGAVCPLEAAQKSYPAWPAGRLVVVTGRCLDGDGNNGDDVIAVVAANNGSGVDAS
ncbi:hypothetical protein R6Q59_032680 [Mikania micrantha]